MIGYPVRIQPDGDGYLATFRDIPEAITGAKTQEEVLHMAQEALITAMDFYFEDKREVPNPSSPAKDEVLVELPVSLYAKVLLLNEMVNQNVRPAMLANKLHTSRQEVNRLTNLKHPTKIDSIADAMKVLGKRLTVTMQ